MNTPSTPATDTSGSTAAAAARGSGKVEKFPYIPALDGVRGLLVFPVLLFHFSLIGDMTHIAKGSFLAPSMFFALSGFLITSLVLIEHQRNGEVSWGGFWNRRFRRLVPASLSVVVGCALLPVIWTGAWPKLPASDALSAILSVKNWQSISLEQTEGLRLLGPLSPYWSLAIEEQFYLGLSIVLGLALRRRAWQQWLVGTLGVVWCWSVASLILIDGTANRKFFGTDMRASELVAGCLLAVVVNQRGWPRSRHWSTVGWVGLAATVAAWSLVDETQSWLLGGGLAAISVLNLALIMGAIVPGTSFATAFTFRPLVELGKISYPMYLAHWPVALATRPVLTGFGGWPLMGVRFVLTLAISVPLAYWVEAPIRHGSVLKGRLFYVVWASVAVSTVVFCFVWGRYAA